MMGYKNKVTSLAGAKQLNEVQLVVNLFQSVLDGFIRGEIKRKGAVDPVKVSLCVLNICTTFRRFSLFVFFFA